MNKKFNNLKLRIVIIFAAILGIVYVFFSDFSENDYLSNKTSESKIVDNNITFGSFDISKNDISDDGIIENNNVETNSINKEVETKDKNASFNYGDKININTATENMLITLPSIGKTIAKSIIEYRETYGPFTDITQIKNVKRIGDKTFDKIKNKITVG